MRARASLVVFAFNFFLLIADSSAGGADDPVRYRGLYTYGHEVNSFCPDQNSQCYWVSHDTTAGIRASLRKLVDESSAKPYQPVCVVVEGVLDRDSPRDGFAADYDGVITLSQFYGSCVESRIVIESDLQHHRWVLETVNGERLPDVETDGLVPELDFGEQMHVSGNTGCNRFSGTAVLRDGKFVIEKMTSTMRMCASSWSELELRLQQLLTQESRISLSESSALTLESDDAVLRYRQRDWVE